MSVDLSKAERLKKVSLRKNTIVSLAKQSEELVDLKARVALVMDHSYSMSPLYSEGVVQDVIDRVLPIGLQFDDNGEIDLWIFDDDYRYIGTVNINNFYDVVRSKISRYEMGGTRYAPVIMDVASKYIQFEPAACPNYVIYITDGEPSDRSRAAQALSDVSYMPIFWQFIGIGDCDFDFLERLDNMGGRYVDNANFFALNDLRDISDDELYKRLLQEFPSWLRYPEVKSMIQNPSGVMRPGPSSTLKPKSGGSFISRLFGR